MNFEGGRLMGANPKRLPPPKQMYRLDLLILVFLKCFWKKLIFYYFF